MTTTSQTLTDTDRLAVAEASGLELSKEVTTVREAIAAICTIGYGGHYDEELPDEEEAITALAESIGVDPAVLHDLRESLAERLRGAAQSVISGWEASDA